MLLSISSSPHAAPVDLQARSLALETNDTCGTSPRKMAKIRGVMWGFNIRKNGGYYNNNHHHHLNYYNGKKNTLEQSWVYKGISMERNGDGMWLTNSEIGVTFTFDVTIKHEDGDRQQRWDTGLRSMAIPGSDWLEVPTIYKAYVSGLCKGISPQNMALYGTVPPI